VVRGEVVTRPVPHARTIPADREPGTVTITTREYVVEEGWPMRRDRRIAGLVGIPAFILVSGLIAGVPLGITAVFVLVTAVLWVVVTG